MALNLASLTAGVKTALEAGGADPVNPFTLALAQGIAQAVIDELKNNATVTPTALVAPSGGGPVTGTGKIT